MRLRGRHRIGLTTRNDIFVTRREPTSDLLALQNSTTYANLSVQSTAT